MDLKKIDFNKIINFIKNNYDKEAGLFTVVLCLIIFFGVKQFAAPAIAKLGENITKINQHKQELKQYQARELLAISGEDQKTRKNLPIKIYQAPGSGMDTETASIELVQEVLNIIKETGNSKINQVNFTTQEIKDASGSSSKDYSILSLNLSVEGPFESIQKTLNDIYLMKYLVVIKKIKTEPVDSFSYDSIKTDLTLDLYIKLTNTIDPSLNGLPPGMINGMPIPGAPPPS